MASFSFGNVMKGKVYVLIAAALWGIMGIFVRNVSAQGYKSMDIVTLRMIFSAALMGIYLVVRDRNAFRIKLKDIWVFLGTGLLSLVFFNFCYFNALTRTSLSVAVTLMYTSPAFVLIMAAIFLKEKIKPAQYISLVMALLGCMLVSGIFETEVSLDIITLLFGLGSGLGYGLYSIFGKVATKKGYSSATISFYSFLIGAICSAPLADWKNITSISMSPIIPFSFSGMVVLSTIAAYLFYTEGLRLTPASLAGIIACLEPVVGTAVSFFLYKETITVLMGLGILCVIASATLAGGGIKPITSKGHSS